MPDIRPAAEGDLDQVMAIMRAAFDPRFGEAWSLVQMAGALARPESFGRLVIADGVGQAFSLCREIGPDVELLLVAVAPASRRLGYAGLLVDHAIRDARARSAADMFLEVRSNNEAALRLYRGRGFIEVGRRPDYYAGASGERFAAITMRCNISN
jgi:ribosomal-protein-alanine N-acetyltransferase